MYHNEIKNIKKENELLRKQSEEKYFENKVIDTELDFINHLQQMKQNNYIATSMVSLVVFLGAYFCSYDHIDLNKVSEISLLLGDSAVALLVGTGVGNYINNKILKEIDLNNKTVNNIQEELITKKDVNLRIIQSINLRLISNNELLDHLKEERNNKIVVNNNINKKLVLKKIV